MTRILLLMAALATSVFAADISGKWKGEVQFTTSDGQVKSGPAYFDLKQEGDKVTGIAGPDESEPHQVKEGKLEGNKFTFNILGEDENLKFELTVDGDEMTGTMTKAEQKESAKLHLKRAK